MRNIRSSCALLLFFFAVNASADALFPFSSVREQIDGTCWAYGASHMTEARLENREGFSAAIDIQKTYRYWQIYDRLWNSYLRKKKSDGIFEIGGFSANYWYIMANHGFETFRIDKAPDVPDFSYPYSYAPLIETKRHPNRLHSRQIVLDVEKKLVTKTLTAAEARKLIHDALNKAIPMKVPFSPKTEWRDGAVTSADMFDHAMGTDLAAAGGRYSPYTFVLVTSSMIKDHPEQDGQWVRYDDDRFLAVGEKEVTKILEIARASVDRGWPVTLETDDHVMTLIGYETKRSTDGSTYQYAVVDSMGAYYPKAFSWQSEKKILKYVQDITVFYPAVQDLLPGPSFLKNMRSVTIPRRK